MPSMVVVSNAIRNLVSLPQVWKSHTIDIQEGVTETLHMPLTTIVCLGDTFIGIESQGIWEMSS